MNHPKLTSYTIGKPMSEEEFKKYCENNKVKLVRKSDLKKKESTTDNGHNPQPEQTTDVHKA